MKLVRASTEKRLFEGERPHQRAPMGRVIRSADRRTKPCKVASRNPLGSEGRRQGISAPRTFGISLVVGSCAALISFYWSINGGWLLALPEKAPISIPRSHLVGVLGDKDLLIAQTRNAVRSADVTGPLKQFRVDVPTVPVAEEARRNRPDHGQRLAAQRLSSISVPVRTVFYAPKQIPLQVTALRADQPLASSTKVATKVYSIIRRYAPKHKYPDLIAETIVRESAQQGYDPLFVAAVIKSESAFNSLALSHKGAQGLMQIMPATGAWIATKENLPRHRLSNPQHNVRLGISYLKHLEEEYNGNKVFTLVAYNWGPGHVESASGGKRRIPKECLIYAIKILSDYRRWKAGIL